MARIALMLSLAASWLGAETVAYRIDPAHSAATFAVRHLMVSTVRGQLGRITGTVQYDPADLSKTSINATIDVTGINTREEKRDAHLKSADFFDVEKHPTMTFVSKKTEAAGAGKLKITGDLTIRGVTKSVVLDVDGPSEALKSPNGGTRIGASATTKLNRKEFGVSFGGIRDGTVVVADEVSVTLDVELVSSGGTAKK